MCESPWLAGAGGWIARPKSTSGTLNADFTKAPNRRSTFWSSAASLVFKPL
jgi:hypothetical protein